MCGFRCEVGQHGTFHAEAPPSVTLEDSDYTFCDARQRAGLSVGRRWQVALFEEGGRIVEIGVSTGLVGP